MGRKSPVNELLANPPEVVGDKIKLRSKRLEDALNDYQWRKDEELCFLDATYPVISSFEEFLRSYKQAMKDSDNSYRLAIDTLDGKHIGNCGYFNINEWEGEAEFGIMIGNKDYWNQGYGADVVNTAVNHFFVHPRLQRIYLKTLNWNVRARKCFQKCGFIPCSELRRGEYDFIVMEICRNHRSAEDAGTPIKSG